MKIESAAGEFEFNIESLKIEADDIIIVGKMGVWEAETLMTRGDMRKMLGMTLGKPAFWGYMIKLLFSGNSSTAKDTETEKSNE